MNGLFFKDDMATFLFLEGGIIHSRNPRKARLSLLSLSYLEFPPFLWSETLGQGDWTTLDPRFTWMALKSQSIYLGPQHLPSKVLTEAPWEKNKNAETKGLRGNPDPKPIATEPQFPQD